MAGYATAWVAVGLVASVVSFYPSACKFFWAAGAFWVIVGAGVLVVVAAGGAVDVAGTFVAVFGVGPVGVMGAVAAWVVEVDWLVVWAGVAGFWVVWVVVVTAGGFWIEVAADLVLSSALVDTYAFAYVAGC